MQYPHFRPGLLIAVALLAALAPARAAAEEPKSGAIYYRNRTDSEIKIEGRYIIDADGDKLALSGYWKLKPGQECYLAQEGKKIVARKFAYRLTTADGSSDWVGSANVLDKDGDFVLAVTPDNLAEHKKLTGAKGTEGDKPTLKARRSKEAWDEMGKVDARTAPIGKRDAVEYWETFNVGYGLINKDDIDPDLDRLIRDWVSVSADHHGAIVKYQRARGALVQKRDELGPCPAGGGPAFVWGFAFGALTRQISDLDNEYQTVSAALSRRKAEAEKREGEVARTLASRYPAYRFSR